LDDVTVVRAAVGGRGRLRLYVTWEEQLEDARSLVIVVDDVRHADVNIYTRARGHIEPHWPKFEGGCRKTEVPRVGAVCDFDESMITDDRPVVNGRAHTCSLGVPSRSIQHDE
jgi:hypothetical protein